MDSGAIIIYLNWCGSRQAVSVRPIGLSCVEAVKDWVASLRPNSEPFEIAGLKSLGNGETIWTSELPDNLGPGIPQQRLLPGGDYEVILSSASSRSSAPIFVETPAFNQAPIYVDTTGAYGDFRPPPIPVEPLVISSPARIYPVCHPFLGGAEIGAPSPLIPAQAPAVHKHVTNIYYLDEFGNRISGPEAVLNENKSYAPKQLGTSSGFHSEQQSGHQRSARSLEPHAGRPSRRSASPPTRRSHSSGHATAGSPSRQSPSRLTRSESAGNIFDRLAQRPSPRKPKPKAERKPSLSNDERQEVVERLLMPRSTYEPDEDEGFDPNLRTVYRKMTPEDLDMFVYRMYAPHKHSAPRRDIYDEQKEAQRRANTFRDDIPAEKPPMDFRRPDSYDDDEEEVHPPVKLTERERKEAAERLYEAAKKAKDKQKMREQEHDRQMRAPMASKKMSAAAFKEMNERLWKIPKPPAAAPEAKKKLVFTKEDYAKKIETWSKKLKRENEPELPQACKRERKKVSYDSYTKMMDRLALPGAREKYWRMEHPVKTAQQRTDEEKKKKEGPAKWKSVF